MPKQFRDGDALASRKRSQAADPTPVRHVKKANKRQRGAEVVFDPKAHREYLTGFRKRKDKRRKEAQQHLKAKAVKERIDARAEKRAKLKSDLGLTDDYEFSKIAPSVPVTHPNIEEKGKGKGANETVYQSSQFVTTVRTIPVWASSEEDSGDDSE